MYASIKFFKSLGVELVFSNILDILIAWFDLLKIQVDGQWMTVIRFVTKKMYAGVLYYILN